MGRNIIYILYSPFRFLYCLADCTHCTVAIRMGGGHMMPVCGESHTSQYAVYFGVPCLRAGLPFQNDNAAAFSQNQPFPLPIKGLAQIRGEGEEPLKSGKCYSGKYIHPPCDYNVGKIPFQQLFAQPHGIISAGTCGGNHVCGAG